MSGGTRPRVGFLGVGWIGRSRMEAIVGTGALEAVGVAEPSDEAAQAALALAPNAARVTDLDALLDLELDGLVIATPSALHAAQSIQALERGVAVFCQKPLGRTAAETAAVVEAARAADRLLGVDLSYRHTAAMRAIRERIAADDLGRVYAIDLVFHNAYGPDKAWFRDRALSGGGCVIDLGVHLVDLALWVLDFPSVHAVDSHLFAGGVPLVAGSDSVEDFASATLTLEGGTVVRLACSWNLPAGREAQIEAAFTGTDARVALRNRGGSFYDFEAELTHGASSRSLLAEPPDDWSGRAAADWALRLGAGERFSPACEELVTVARVLDAIYAQGSRR